MIFLTYNDYYSGIYQSQVIDVCEHIDNTQHVSVRLVAFVSIRRYFKERKILKRYYKKSWILPMFPTVRFYRWNSIVLFFLCLFTGERCIWARGVFSSLISLSLKNSGLCKYLLFDARGAYQAEANEFKVIEDRKILNAMGTLEKRALKKSDAQLAVSEELRKWWQVTYDFLPDKSIVIPCTVNKTFEAQLPEDNDRDVLRGKLGIDTREVVLVFSGGAGGWQSLEILETFLSNFFRSHANGKLLFLSESMPRNSQVFQQYKLRIIHRWVPPHEVRNYLVAGDYGLLLRPRSVTNLVASPVKFAEYLCAGLKVIISEGIGDYSAFVRERNCGFLNDEEFSLGVQNNEERLRVRNIGMQFFSKNSEAINARYQEIIIKFQRQEEKV